MKALVINKYGSAKDLAVQEVPIPSLGAHQVLVEVYTSAVNDYDWCLMRGKPYAYRLLFGLFKPKNKLLGMELAGVVHAVGENVSNFAIGDRVYGDTSDFGFGTFAEFMAISPKALTKMPTKMSFEEAVTIPHAGLLAYQSLIDCANIQHGEKVLVNGAGGGVGTFAVQIAKTFEAHITGIDSNEKLDYLLSIGFDEGQDYRKVNYTKTGQQYDVIIDAKTNQTPAAYKKALTKNGRYVSIGGDVGAMISVVLKGRLWDRQFQVPSLKTNQGLERLNELFIAGKLKPTIDGPYYLNEAAAQIERFGKGLHQGKIVIRLKG